MVGRSRGCTEYGTTVWKRGSTDGQKCYHFKWPLVEQRVIQLGKKTLKIKPKTDAGELEECGLYVAARMSFQKEGLLYGLVCLAVHGVSSHLNPAFMPADFQ